MYPQKSEFILQKTIHNLGRHNISTTAVTDYTSVEFINFINTCEKSSGVHLPWENQVYVVISLSLINININYNEYSILKSQTTSCTKPKVAF